MHFITAIGYDADGYIYANDPNKSAAPRKQLESKFKSCMKQAFIFWPQRINEPEPEPDKPTENQSTPSADAKKDKAIVDISKWQGDIDFDKFAPDVAFVIARAGVGSDADPLFDSYAKAMIDRKVPFGVYCYSYAGTEAKAKDEAKKLVSRASKYNPLFYVMDAEEAKITTAAIRAFAEALRAAGAERIGCYVAHHRYKQYNYDGLRSLFNFTWIPCYGKNDGTIDGSKKPSYVCDLWQYTSNGQIAGITETYQYKDEDGNTLVGVRGRVDLNVITGQGKTLEWFLGGNGTYEPAQLPKDDPATEAAAEYKVQIHSGNVNVRTAPNTSGKIIGVAYNGDVLEYGGKINPDNGWISVKFLGQTAWVSNKYSRLI